MSRRRIRRWRGEWTNRKKKKIKNSATNIPKWAIINSILITIFNNILFSFLSFFHFLIQLSDSNDSYTPLQRPNTSIAGRETASSLPSSLNTSGITKMEEASELEESLAESESDSGSDCDFSNARNRSNKKKVPKYVFE